MSAVLALLVPGAEGRAALAAATAEAERRGARLVVAGEEGLLRAAVDDPVHAESLRAAQAIEVEAPADGDALATIVADEGVDLVVVGMRRREGAGRLLVATPAMRAVLAVDATVLVVRP